MSSRKGVTRFILLAVIAILGFVAMVFLQVDSSTSSGDHPVLRQTATAKEKGETTGTTLLSNNDDGGSSSSARSSSPAASKPLISEKLVAKQEEEEKTTVATHQPKEAGAEHSSVTMSPDEAKSMDAITSKWENDEELQQTRKAIESGLSQQTVDYAIVEVGTNSKPDYLRYIKRDQRSLLVGLEPIVTEQAALRCARISKERCFILDYALGPHEQTAEMNVGFTSVCSSLLPLTDPKSHCTRKVAGHKVKVIRLDSLIKFALPPQIPIKILMLDMQGFDLYGAASLTNTHFLRNRVANFMLECQDLPSGDPKFMSPGSRSCGEAISCITKHWQYTFVGCTRNMGPAEFNCMFYNPNHKDGDPKLSHPFSNKKISRAERELKTSVEHPAECPEFFTNVELVPRLPEYKSEDEVRKAAKEI